MKKIFGIILPLSILASVSAQDRKLALEYFELGNFEEAIEEYKLLLEEDSANNEYNYNLGVSYLNINIDKALAIPHFELLTKNPKIEANAWYLLGRAYHFGYKFDKAIAAYQKFGALDKGSTYNREDIELQIDYCQNAKEMMKFPVAVSFENLGKSINSVYADYYPFIPVDESYVLFNSKRDINSKELEDGSYLPSIYMSKVKDGKFQKSVPLPSPINTEERKEEVVGLNADGTRAIFYFEDFQHYGDLYESKIEGNVLREPVKLEKTINSKHTEIAGCVTSDGRKFYFASDRPGGYGGVDIYSCQMLPNGQWSEPLNAGPTINTKYDEDFPNISPDGKTLYFSSKGHTSMGGYDIFKAKWDGKKLRLQVFRTWGIH